MNQHPPIKSTRSTITLVLVTVIVFTVISQMFTNTSVFGYGYGYGYGQCTPIGPKNLSATLLTTLRRIQITWTAANFTACGSSTQHYQLFIWKHTKLVHHKTVNAASTSTTVRYNQLTGRGRYRYQIIAYSTDSGTLASDYDFFTIR